MIKIEKVNKIYPNGFHAVKDVSLEIKKGDIFGVIGLSGAGKSSLIRLLNRLEEPTSGKIIIDGVDMTSLSKNELLEKRKKIGMIFQHFNLLASRTVGENVAFALEIAGWEKSKIKDRVKELLEVVELSSKIDSYPSQLSGGQKQRVAIARALALNPKVLLCDEATSALDPNTTKSILTLIEDINKKMGITVVVVTHQMEVIKQICGRIAIMENGQVLEVGETEEIFLKNTAGLRKLLGEENIVLPEGTNVKILFPKDISNDSIITSMARELDIDVSIVFGRLEKFKDDVLGSLIINVPDKNGEAVKKFLTDKDIRWEEIENVN